MYKLSPSQAKVIVAAQLDAECPPAKLRSQVGLKDYTIRYTLSRAQELGIIERRHFVNLFKLGYLQHEIFFSLSSEQSGVRESLLAQLKASDRISWIGRLGGDYQYGINVCSRDALHLSDFFNSLSGTFGHLLVEKSLSVRIGLTYFGNRYLYPNLKAAPPLSYHPSTETISLDQTDHRVLSALTSRGHASGHELSRILGIPQSTVDYRLKKLKSSGVIVGSYYAFCGDRVGISSFLCLIATRGIGSTFRRKMFEFCNQNPEIVVLIESVGNWDFEFVIDALSSESAMRTSEKILDHLGRDVHWMKVIPLFSYPKVNEYPFTTL
jgi:DNA-binding Lrp family transcriptional regulator